MIRVVHPGSRILTFNPSRIQDPGVKKAPDPGSGSAALIILIDNSRLVAKYHGPDSEYSILVRYDTVQFATSFELNKSQLFRVVQW